MADRPPWLDETRRPPKSIPASATRPAPLLFDDQHRAIGTRDEWSQRSALLRQRWQAFLGTIERPRSAPPYRILAEDREDEVRRRLIRYEGEAGLPVEAYLLSPLTAPTNVKRPGAVVLHSTTDETIQQPAGLAGPADKHIGLHLAKSGFEVICPRCFLWQYSRPGKLAEAVEWLKRLHPNVTGMAKMLFDGQRAIDLLESLPAVDAKRIGAIGHSLGAKETLYLAAFDERVRAAVFSEGGIGLTYSNWDAPWYLGESIRRPGFPFDHGQVVAQIAPRAFLLIGGESADGDASWPYIEAAQPVWSLLGCPDAIGFLNHRQGHAYPASARDRSTEWLAWFLRA
jgi:dienelactone hydrolase